MQINRVVLATGFSIVCSLSAAHSSTFFPLSYFTYEFSYGGQTTFVSEPLRIGEPGFVPDYSSGTTEGGLFELGFAVRTADPINFAGETIRFERGIERSYDPLNLEFIYLEQDPPNGAYDIYGDISFGPGNQITEWDFLLRDISTRPKYRSFFDFTSQPQRSLITLSDDSSNPLLPDNFGSEFLEDDVILGLDGKRFFHEPGVWTLSSFEVLCIEDGTGPIELSSSDVDYPVACLPSAAVAPIPVPASGILAVFGIMTLGALGQLGGGRNRFWSAHTKSDRSLFPDSGRTWLLPRIN